MRPTCRPCLEGEPQRCTGWAVADEGYWARCSHPSAWHASSDGSAFGEHGHDEREMAS